MIQKCLRLPAVREITGLSRSAIYDQMSKGLFPRPVQLTAKAVGWPERVISEWLESRPSQTK